MAQTVYHAPAPEQAQGTPPKKGKKKKWLILLLALLLLALLAAGGFFVWQYFNRGELMEPNATIGVMPGKTDQEIIDELNRKVDERSIALTINPAPVAEDVRKPPEQRQGHQVGGIPGRHRGADLRDGLNDKRKLH